MHSNVLLEDKGIGELLVTNWTLVKDSKRGLHSVDTHVCLQIPFSSKRPPANLAFERPLPSVSSIVHLQG